MASGEQNQEERVPENLRRRLAVAVRSVQWSYAIFWKLSTREEGLLEWGDGYYNGDIRTRKTVQAMEFKADKMGLQRSEQLRELYECLSEGETDQQAKRPSAALSPDDLSNAEWYYLVCMSFVFSPGQGLPGRALANGQPIWLCNAHSADSKVFSRSLLAKSASIQTVICFPHLGGVIELGITELVLEEPSLIQHIKTALLELSKPACSGKSSSAPYYRDDDADYMHAKVGHEIVNTLALENFCSQTEDVKFDQEGPNEIEGNIQDDFSMGSPDDCSNGCEHNHQEVDSFLLEGIKDGTSQVQSWQFMCDDVSNGVQDSMNSSDCISQVFVNQEKVLSPPKTGNMNNNSLKELQECNHAKFGSLDIGADDDLHYKRTLSAVLRKSYPLLDNLCSRSCNFKSSFMSWKKGEIMKIDRPQVQQKMLKKILFNVPSMHGSCLLKPGQENSREDWLLKPEFNEFYIKQALPDKKTENEKFLVLKSMVPSISKIDKPSILADTIEYLKVLEARIEELESCIDLADYESKGRRKYPDVVERTSENYENGRIDNGKKHPINKRKACDVDEDLELSSAVPTDGPALDLKVKIREQEVLIEMSCPWREYLLLDIIDAMNNLNLDAHTVQSSTTDGILTVTLQKQKTLDGEISHRRQETFGDEMNDCGKNILGGEINDTGKEKQFNKCKNQCRPVGSEALPEGIVAKTSDFEMHPLWGPIAENKNSKASVSLLAVAVGIKQKETVKEIVKKFLDDGFVVMLFHYDNVVDEWSDLGWSSRVIHVSAMSQTKWWFAKRFLHPDIVAEYDYIFLWDEDLGVEDFHPARYLSIVKDEGLEISQPALDPNKSDWHYQITARLAKSKVHRRIYKPRGSGICNAHSTAPPCTGWVEMMAPVFSRAAWRCVWYMIQNDLIHAWGIDKQLGYCAQGDRTKNVGVVDSEYIVHLGFPTLGVSEGGNKKPPRLRKNDGRLDVRRRSFEEMRIFEKRWNNSAEEDKCWVDPYQEVNHLES